MCVALRSRPEQDDLLRIDLDYKCIYHLLEERVCQLCHSLIFLEGDSTLATAL